MKRASFNGHVVALAEESKENPFQTRIRYIFTDYSPNNNKQGIKRSEASNLIKSALYMPVKINFDGYNHYGHQDSVPVGPIVAMREENDVLIADAIIWNESFPDLVDYLNRKFTEEKQGVGFSWELYYMDSEKDEDEVEWLSNCTVAGSTIVSNPAYGDRTFMMAMAEEKEDLAKQVADLRDSIDSAFKELNILRRDETMSDSPSIATAEVVETVEATLQEQDTAPEVTEISTETLALTRELEELRLFKQSVEAKAARSESLGNRKVAMEAAGIRLSDEDFEAKSDFIVGMSEDQFKAYLDTTSTILRSSKAESKGSEIIPDPIIGGAMSAQVSLSQLASLLKSVR